MTAAEFTQLLCDLQRADPFRAFAVELASGSRVEVDRANAYIARDGVAAFLAAGGIPHWFDSATVKQIIAMSPDGGPAG